MDTGTGNTTEDVGTSTHEERLDSLLGTVRRRMMMTSGEAVKYKSSLDA